MNIYEKLKWYFLGEVSEMADKEYQDGFDAIFFPAFCIVFGGSTGYAALELSAGPVWQAGIASLLALLSLFLAFLLVISLGASIVYATQRTELPEDPEVVADGFR